MSETTTPTPADPVDELVDELLGCGAVLSQIIAHMVESRNAGRSAPEAAPIPEMAHSLIYSAVHGVVKQHSKRDIRGAASIVSQATEAICEEIFFVNANAEDLDPVDG
jgi:hypothetical protein